jgi:hypothetical protein
MRRGARGGARSLLLVCGAAALGVAAACGRGNPVLGDWELDRAETSPSAVLAAEATDLTAITFRRDAIAAKDTVIPVNYEVEGARVRAIRGDGRGEHAIEALPDGRIRVELPIGVTAVYRKRGP